MTILLTKLDSAVRKAARFLGAEYDTHGDRPFYLMPTTDEVRITLTRGSEPRELMFDCEKLALLDEHQIKRQIIELFVARDTRRGAQ